MKKTSFLIRMIICSVIILLIFSGFVLRLFDWQIVHGSEYRELSASSTSYTERSSATRGEILDVNGKALAVNQTAYNIAINKIYIRDNETNDIILLLIDLLNKCEGKFRDVLPIHLSGGKF